LAGTQVVLLGVTAGLGSPWVGAVLLFAFAIGRAIPIALGSIVMGWLENLRALTAYRRAFEVLGGVLLIVSGGLLLLASSIGDVARFCHECPLLARDLPKQVARF